MNVEREVLYEAGLSIGAVLLFILIVVYIGTTYGSDNLSGTGAYALVGAMVFFIVALSTAGYLLEKHVRTGDD